jgi:hypothetical protein
MRLKKIHFVLVFLLMAIFLILYNSIFKKCKTLDTAKNVATNFPFYETNNPDVYALVDNLFEVREKIAPGGGYFGSHSRWAKLRVNGSNANENSYEVDLFFSYRKDGIIALNSCNIFVVSNCKSMTLYSDKGWYFSDELVNKICSKIALEFSLPMPRSNGVASPAPFTLSCKSIDNSVMLKKVVSMFNNASIDVRRKSKCIEIARIEVSDDSPKSMADLLNLANNACYYVSLYDDPGYFEITEYSHTDINFTQKKVVKLCYDYSMYCDFIKALGISCSVENR